jgi:exonuclease SbcC
MKPLRLQLKNYRTFESVDIQFDRIEAASITGSNGAGKSSIVEAILYALFGDGRSSGVDGVVKLGESEASVQLDYLHNGNDYRIIRKRSRGRKSDLQYMVSPPGHSNGGPDDSPLLPLTAPSIRETQEKINHDLAMDSSLFRHSSCVIQGDSAGICEATAAERKAVLYQILEDRLSKFGPLHEAAKATVKAIDEATIAARSKRDELDRRVALKPDEQEAHESARKRLAGLRVEMNGLEAQAESLRDTLARSQAEIDKIDAINKTILSIEDEILQANQRATENRAIVEVNEALLTRAPEIREQCKRADEVEKQLEELSQKRERHQEMVTLYREKEVEFADKDRDIHSRETDLANSCDAERKPLENEKNLLEFESTILRGQLDSAESQSALLNSVPCKCSPMASECRLLSEAREAVALIPGMNEELESKDIRLAEINELLSNIQKCLLEKGDVTDKEIEELGKQRAESLDAIKAEGRAIGYDAQAHEKLKADYESLKLARAKLPEISAAEAKIEAAEKALTEIDRINRGKRLQILGLEKEREQASKLIIGLEDVRSKLSTVNSEISGLKESVDRTNRELAIHEERLAEIARAEAELQAISGQIKAQDSKRLIYATLQDAFSRDGIPALIIDAAVPAIEEIANDILSHLSDGRMMLKFITQKAKVSGGIAETLDIIVSDSQGERPYEDWSGGEKLRIDLSVRIALGRLLAQRTGAKIELLMLDEVCAPLDQAGEDALVECIDRLRSSFGCILLITHRESLRDRLPQQITVNKNGNSSYVEVLA